MAADNSNGANIEELTGKTEQFIEDNSRNLIIAIAAVAVIIVSVVGYGKFIVEPTETAANEDTWRAEQYFMMDSVDLALNGDGLYPGLYDIADDHDGTKAAARAQYEIGLILRGLRSARNTGMRPRPINPHWNRRPVAMPSPTPARATSRQSSRSRWARSQKHRRRGGMHTTSTS